MKSTEQSAPPVIDQPDVILGHFIDGRRVAGRDTTLPIHDPAAGNVSRQKDGARYSFPGR